MVSSVYIRPLLALLVMAAIIGIAVVVIRDGSQESKQVPSAVQQLPQNIDIALKKARFSEIQESLLVWELVAERAEYDKTGDTAYLKDIRMEFQKTPSQGAITVTADSGDYFVTKKDIFLHGGDILKINKSELKLKLITFNNNIFFKVFKEKLLK